MVRFHIALKPALMRVREYPSSDQRMTVSAKMYVLKIERDSLLREKRRGCAGDGC
jgi:hypothetical protein